MDLKGSVINDGSHDLLDMLSSVRRFFSWPRPFLQSSSFFTVKLHFHISSRRFLNFLYRIQFPPSSLCLSGGLPAAYLLSPILFP